MRKISKEMRKEARPDTRPIPVADGWAGAEMRVFTLFDSCSRTNGGTDGPTEQQTDKGSYRVACPQLKRAPEYLNVSRRAKRHSKSTTQQCSIVACSRLKSVSSGKKNLRNVRTAQSKKLPFGFHFHTTLFFIRT